MSDAHTFIEDFNPFNDDVADFLLRCRNEFNEHYGRWMQTSYLEPDDPSDGAVVVVQFSEQKAYLN